MKLPLLKFILASILLVIVPHIGLAQTATAEKPMQAEAEPLQAETEPTKLKDQRMPAEILKGKVKLRVGEGENLFWFKKQTESSCKLYGADEKEVAELSYKGKTLKVKSPSGEELFEVKPKDEKVMILDAKTGKELFKMKLKLKDNKIDFYLPNEKRVYRIKKKDYGWRLEDNANNTLFRVKNKSGKIVLRDTSDKTVLYSKEVKLTLPLVFFKIKELSKEQKAACALFFMTPTKPAK